MMRTLESVVGSTDIGHKPHYHSIISYKGTPLVRTRARKTARSAARDGSLHLREGENGELVMCYLPHQEA